MLRLGRSVLGVRNNGYTPDGRFNNTGTTVPGTVRITKEHE
jgi:type IV secretion system protein VirB9